MTQLPTNRTDTSTVPEHVADHNTLHAQHNDLDGHAADTTSVHGITDTSALETTTGSAAKVAAHEADTTSVHGITNTADLASTASLASHEADTTSIHGITDTSALYLTASHTKAAHDSLAMSHDSLSDVSANDHHAQAHHAAHEPSGADAMAVDAAAGTGSLRTLGAGAAQAAPGDHAHSGTYVAADGLTTLRVNTAAPSSPATGDVWIDSDATSTLQHTHTGTYEPSGTVATHAAAADPHTGYVLESLLDAKGDLIAASADNTPAKLTVGTNGRGLVADSTATPGVAWGGPMSLRDLAFMPTGAIAETISRAAQINTSSTLVSGTLYLQAIALPAGAVISSISFTNGGTVAGSPTNWWFGLYDLNRNQLAVTADQLTAAWAANTFKTLAIATTAGGAASSFTTTYAGLHYLGFMMKATTPVNFSVCIMAGNIFLLTPLLFGTSSTSQTTPPAFPFQAAAMTGSQGMPYAYVS